MDFEVRTLLAELRGLAESRGDTLTLDRLDDLEAALSALLDPKSPQEA